MLTQGGQGGRPAPLAVRFHGIPARCPINFAWGLMEVTYRRPPWLSASYHPRSFSSSSGASFSTSLLLRSLRELSPPGMLGGIHAVHQEVRPWPVRPIDTATIGTTKLGFHIRLGKLPGYDSNVPKCAVCLYATWRSKRRAKNVRPMIARSGPRQWPSLRWPSPFSVKRKVCRARVHC